MLFLSKLYLYLYYIVIIKQCPWSKKKKILETLNMQTFKIQICYTSGIFFFF